MKFNEQLNEYINTINCTSKELSEIAKLSATTISRYRNGDRMPIKESKQLEQLSFGLAQLALQKNLENLSQKTIFSKFNETLTSISINSEQLQKNFNELISIFKINMAEMARSLNFDASYLSRIRTGKRQPSNANLFIDSVCRFIIRRYSDDSSKKVITNLLKCSLEDISDSTKYLSKLTQWFSSNNFESHDYINDFLKKMDEFNLNEYICLIHFDKLKIPTLPFQLPTSKNYYGLSGMKQGELDFLKSTVLSKSLEPLFMCSDMPMEDMAEDLKFGKDWMLGIAMCLKKGLHLNMIHNLERPFNELMLGLESWIPIYMTGQISPYYIKSSHSNVYGHLNYVSGASALTGECINGFHSKGKYYLTNNKEEVSYYKQKSVDLLSKAQPLMEIYKKDSKNFYNAFVSSDAEILGTRRSIMSSLPIHTISEKLLIKILKRNNIEEKAITEISNYILEEKEIIKTILSKSTILDEFTELSPEEFEKYPIQLSLSGLFNENKITYNYEEYLEHLKLTKKFANSTHNYQIKLNDKNAFRNIQIFIHENKWVMISKDTNPAIHFVIKHPKLRTAIENFVAPIVE